jgi:exportin-1
LDAIGQALTWMLHILALTDKSVEADNFRSCCEMWGAVARRCYLSHGVDLSFYAPFFPPVRRILINKMERPEDIIVVDGEMGELVRAENRDTVTLELYRVMKEALVFLTNIDPRDTLAAVRELFAQLQEQWSDDRLNSLTWSVGAISGALPVTEESNFLCDLLANLLAMNADARESRTRAFLAEGILFICAQHPRFLTSHPTLMKAVIEKLLEFMHHDILGVREMAVHSFRTIASKCRRRFLSPQKAEAPLIDQIIPEMERHCAELAPELIVEMYEALATIIAGYPEGGARALQGRDMMKQMTAAWNSQLAQFDPANVDCLRRLATISQANVAVADALGPAFHMQFERMFESIAGIYPEICLKAAEMVQNVQHWDRFEEFRLYRVISSAIVSILIRYCQSVAQTVHIVKDILPRIAEAFLPIFSQVHPECRTSEILTLIAQIATRVKEQISPYVPHIWATVFHPTFAILRDDHDGFPDFRFAMAGFLEAFARHCPDTVLNFPPEEIDNVVAMLELGVQDPGDDICRAYLKAMYGMVSMVDGRASIDFKAPFFAAFFDRILQTAFSVMADTFHKFAFKEQVRLIRKLLLVGTALNNQARLAEMLFHNFQTHDLKFYHELAGHMLENAGNEAVFQEGMKDFLILVKEYSYSDAHLNQDEIDAHNRAIAEANSQIPGLIGPPEETDEDFLA